jgi:hypothetical protein
MPRWPADCGEATIALLNARPAFAPRTLATIHLDMIGGDTEVTKSILRVYGSPPSFPSFVSDVGFTFGEWSNAQSLAIADSGSAAFPLIDPAGSRRALQAEIFGRQNATANNASSLNKRSEFLFMVALRRSSRAWPPSCSGRALRDVKRREEW